MRDSHWCHRWDSSPWASSPQQSLLGVLGHGTQFLLWSCSETGCPNCTNVKSQHASNACKCSKWASFNKHLVAYLLFITLDPQPTAWERQILHCVESSEALGQFKVKIKTIHQYSVWSLSASSQFDLLFSCQPCRHAVYSMEALHPLVELLKTIGSAFDTWRTFFRSVCHFLIGEEFGKSGVVKSFGILWPHNLD